MAGNIDNTIIDLLIDNQIVKTALRNEGAEIRHLLFTAVPALILFIVLAVYHFGFDKTLDDPVYLILMLALWTLVIIMVGLYPWINWLSSKTHRFIGKMGISIMIGNIAALLLNIYLGRPLEVTMLIFWVLFCIGPMWFLSLYYRRHYVISGISALKGGPLKDGDLIEMMVDQIAAGYDD